MKKYVHPDGVAPGIQRNPSSAPVRRQPGCDAFTLIEIIVTLLIVSVVMTMTAFMVTPLLRSQELARDRANVSQLAQQMIWRIGRDLATMTNVLSSTSTSLDYEALDSSGVAHEYELDWAGPGMPITVDGFGMLLNVYEFKLAYLDRHDGVPQTTCTPQTRMIELTVDMGSEDSRFQTRVFARNL